MAYTVNWVTIADEFRLLREALENVDLPSPDELDCYKASLVVPAIRSNLLAQLELNQRHWIKSADLSMPLRSALQALGLIALDDALPKHIRADTPDHMAIIEAAITAESLTLEFLHSWGQVQKSSALLSAIFMDDGAAYKDFKKRMKSAVSAGDTTLQKYWYAHWVSSRKGTTKSKIDDEKPEINDELAELCADICQGRREPLVFDRKWFRTLIEKDPADPESWVLKTPYSRLSRKEIRRMAANKLIPKSALPPVAPGDFPAFRRACHKPATYIP